MFAKQITSNEPNFPAGVKWGHGFDISAVALMESIQWPSHRVPHSYVNQK